MPGVVRRRDANEDSGRRSTQPIGRNTGILERLPREFEQETLLRIERRGFAR